MYVYIQTQTTPTMIKRRLFQEYKNSSKNIGTPYLLMSLILIDQRENF